MSPFSRRTFLKTSGVAAAGRALPARAWGQVLGANSDLRVAVIGLNGRGKNHLASLAKIPGVRVVALCDVDSAVLTKVKPTVNGGDVKTYVDIRELLASPDVDAVTIATPNHWHSLAAIWAMQAGKDVYLEKPVSHNIWEGRQLVNAASKYKDRVIQAGTQIRSGEGLRGCAMGARGQPRRHQSVAWLLLQAPREHRPLRRSAARAVIDQLRSVERAATRCRATPQHQEWAGALRLALDLALWQRRCRQPGHSPDGRRALVPRRPRTD